MGLYQIGVVWARSWIEIGASGGFVPKNFGQVAAHRHARLIAILAKSCRWTSSATKLSPLIDFKRITVTTPRIPPGPERDRSRKEAPS